jgi:hypothetical protein
MESPRRTLIVANRTAATPLLLEEVRRRARERPTTFALLVPEVGGGRHPDWTLADAIPLLERAAGSQVEGLVGGDDPLSSIQQTLAEQSFDDVLISTLPKRTSEWLRRDLPSRVKRLGVPVTVITPEKERLSSSAAPPGPGPVG